MAQFQAFDTQNQTPQQPQPVNQTTQPSRARRVLRYTMMPEILPRIRALGFHFGHFAYLLALVFASARLIPAAHPVLNAANIGHYGIRQVIALAANNLVWDKKHIDQIAVFGAIIIGLIMIVIQAGLIAVYALIGGDPAHASASSFFETPDGSQDLAFSFLAQVFGDLDGFWTDSSGNTAIPPGIKTPIHEGLHAMLSLYSMATMVIAVIIVLYYILTVVGEAAQTGTPFGKRFNSLWAPIRLVVALGLLVPLGSGLNSAQYITLWMAKMGSGLGSQVWEKLATELINNPENTSYVVDDYDPIWVLSLTRSIFVSEVCKETHNKLNGGSGRPFISRVPLDTSNNEFHQYTIHWTASDQQQNSPDCGAVRISIQKQLDEDQTENRTTLNLANQQVVPTDQVFTASVQLVEGIAASVQTIARNYANYSISVGGSSGTNPLSTIGEDLNSIAETHTNTLKNRISNIYSSSVRVRFEEILSNNVDQGWVTAGLWYIKIGQLIQSIQTPLREVVPMPEMPASDLLGADDGTWFSRTFGTGANTEVQAAVKNAYDATYFLVSSAHVNSMATAVSDLNPAKAEVCAAMGLTGPLLDKVKCFIYGMITPASLLKLRAEPTLDPMSTLIAAGSEITSKAIKGFVAGFGAIAAGGIAGSIPIPGLGALGALVTAAGHLAIFLGLLGFAAGLILFYALPLFPFIYFFFAVVSWVMEIFEAVVAMPLWALAHLRIDGDGMPGQAAMNGYLLLLAILIRPGLIILGLIGGYIIFGGGVFLLQSLFDPLLGVVHNDRMYGFDLLIYTVVYAYLCYSLALMCFKMVDTVPGNILRWIGNNPGTFTDQKPEDPIGSATAAVVAGTAIGSKAGEIVTSTGAGVGSAIGKPVGRFIKNRLSPDPDIPPETGDGSRGSTAPSGSTGGLGGTGGGTPTSSSGFSGSFGERRFTGRDSSDEDSGDAGSGGDGRST